MDITICENLKQFRKAKGNTQEELAEHLAITIQAVSKWERNEGFPDITLLPKIAAYYDVTVDDLLGVGKMKMEKKINEYHAKSDGYQRNAQFDENLSLWTEAVGEFPNSHSVLHGYMMALFMKNQSSENVNDYADETIKVGERLFKEAYEPYYRYDVIWLLSRLYTRLGNKEKAMEYAQKAPSMDITQENLASLILKGDEAVNCIQENLCCYTNAITSQVYAMTREGNFTNEGQRKAAEYCLTLYNALFTDGDYGFYATQISGLYAQLAVCDAADKHGAGVMKNLALAAEYAVIFLTQGGFKRTSLLVNRTSHPDGHRGYPNSAGNDCTHLLNKMKQDMFDFCRDDEQFKAIAAKLAEYAE